MGGRRGARTSGGGGATDQELARERERAAIVSLALAQLDERAEVQLREQFGDLVPSLDDAMRDLAELTRTKTRISQRAFSLQLLAKVARNRGVERLAPATPSLHVLAEAAVADDRELVKAHARRLEQAKAERSKAESVEAQPVEATEPTAAVAPVGADAPRAAAASGAQPSAADGGPPTRLTSGDPVIQQVFHGFHAAAEPRDAGQTAWEAFVEATSAEQGGPLHFRDEELRLPRCTDDHTVTIDGHRAFRVVTWFSTPKPAIDFEHWTDPRRWDTDCHLFYEKVETKDPAALAAPPDGDYSAVFTEVVRFTPLKTLTTELVFTRTCQPPNLFAVHFTLADPNGTPDILVDSGSLVARHDDDLPPEIATQITAEKCIAFTDPSMALWPTLCCDLLWTELTMTVALGCAQDHY